MCIEKISRQFDDTVWDEFKLERFGLFFGYGNRAGHNFRDEVNKKVMDYYFKDFGHDGVKGDLGETFYRALGHRHYHQVCLNQSKKFISILIRLIL